MLSIKASTVFRNRDSRLDCGQAVGRLGMLIELACAASV